MVSPTALTLQSDGKILAAGTATLSGSSSTSVFSVARYLANGTLDTSYDTDGMQQIDTNASALTYGVVRSAALQADGKLVLVGTDQDTVAANDNWVVARLNVNGSVDTTFSGDGTTTVGFNGKADNANDLIIQSDGKLLVMGSAFVVGNGTDLAAARFNSDGSLDTTFDSDGKFVLPNWTGTVWEQIWHRRGWELVNFLCQFESDPWSIDDDRKRHVCLHSRSRLLWNRFVPVSRV
jgi:serralysin